MSLATISHIKLKFPVRFRFYKKCMFQARVAKKKGQLRKIRNVHDDLPISKAGNKLSKKPKPKQKSSFEDDLTNVSKKKVKSLRYESNKKIKMDKKMKGKFTGNKQKSKKFN